MKGSAAMAIPQKQIYTETDYYDLPEDVRAELIDGQIYYQAAPSRAHQKILSELHITIGTYIRSKGGSCEVYPAPFAVKLHEDRKTIVEPDISVICDHNKLTDRGCTGAPDWIIEIVSPGNSSHDYIRKLNLYADAGVREYWIVNPVQESIYVYHLEETKFGTNAYSFQDKIKVNIYDDLWIDFKEITL
ncbi:UNVERIFIED_CONTAM: Uma2 family endonuclease [Murimonas intestini]|uniref:Uma2 family endonuclease n=2 Tax=Murimonas intestini TaxID=1337051 RepID=A0AB73T7D2_9FIRM